MDTTIQYVIDYKNSYGKYNSKLFTFNDERHYNNWLKKMEQTGNKIIGIRTLTELKYEQLLKEIKTDTEYCILDFTIIPETTFKTEYEKKIKSLQDNGVKIKVITGFPEIANICHQLGCKVFITDGGKTHKILDAEIKNHNINQYITNLILNYDRTKMSKPY